MKNKFRLLHGSYHEGDKSYKAGQEFVSVKPLDTMFTNKFANLGPVEEAKASVPAANPFGDDVTGDYKVAGKEFKVFRKGDEFTVTSVEDTTDSLHEGVLEAKQVVPFIKSLTK